MELRSLTAALIVVAAIVAPRAASAQTFKVEKWNIGGDGGHDYILAEPGTNRLFISRGTHVMVVDGATGKVLGDIPNTPRVHGTGIAMKENHGFTTNGGDSSVTMFDLKTLEALKKISVKVGGLDGIMFDDASNQIVLTNHSNPGTAVTLDAKTGDIVGTVELEDRAPEGAATDGKGKIYVANESKSTMQVIDQKTMKAMASWPLAPCDGPTGVMMDRKSMRIFVGCSKTSVVVDANMGKVVANIENGDGVDALGWDGSQKLIYIPAGVSGNVTVVRQDGPDKYTVVATVATMRGTKTIAVDPVTHRAYALALERGPAPAPAAGAPPVAPGGRGPQGPIVGAWLFAISH
jgi:DNA-binding beta-propeller fold protein YncE